jgi:hypothetical protein
MALLRAMGEKTWVAGPSLAMTQGYNTEIRRANS